MWHDRHDFEKIIFFNMDNEQTGAQYVIAGMYKQTHRAEFVVMHSTKCNMCFRTEMFAPSDMRDVNSKIINTYKIWNAA